jgi:hypothetical protein
MGYLDKILSLVGLYGDSTPPRPQQPTPPHTPTPTSAYTKTIEAPPLEHYPTSEEATQARAGGFGYGEPYSAYVEGTAGRVFADKKGVTPWEGRAGMSPFEMNPSSLVELAGQAPTSQKVSPDVRDRLQDINTRAALATTHSPVATVGYDPRAATFDVSGKSNYSGLYGVTNPETGRMFVRSRPGRDDANEASTVVHESMHRGLMQLREHPAYQKLPAKLRDRMEDFDQDEDLVRTLMARDVGNPEAGAFAKEGGPSWSPDELALIDRVAQQMVKDRRPRGPR